MSTCPRCRCTDLMRIDLEPGDQLRFSACRGCEHRWWTRAGDGSGVELRAVIDAVASS